MTTKIKVIKTEEEYKESLKLIEELMHKDPDPDSEDGEKLNLLITLVKDYESNAFPESLPDPIDAILFRMEQQNLKPRDLIPYMGSRSKVSEVLSRKRPLTMSMIRALETGLGIPAKVLIREPDEFRNTENIVWTHFPLKEMGKRGYFGKKLLDSSNIKNLMEDFLRPAGPLSQFAGMLRKSHYRSLRPMNKHSLVAWSAAVVKKAKIIKYKTIFKPGIIDFAFMQKVAQFSIKDNKPILEDNGPILVQDFLKKHGIALIIEPHFSETYLDGATIMIDKKHPIIGLTLRHDRLDNFWFSLMHELAHISLHYSQNISFFYDDLINDSDFVNGKEKEADEMAEKALLPEDKWEISPARLIPSSMAANSLAKELGIHLAIIAGQIRHRGHKYIYLNKIINTAKIRKYFPDEKWTK